MMNKQSIDNTSSPALFHNKSQKTTTDTHTHTHIYISRDQSTSRNGERATGAQKDFIVIIVAVQHRWFVMEHFLRLLSVVLVPRFLSMIVVVQILVL